MEGDSVVDGIVVISDGEGVGSKGIVVISDGKGYGVDLTGVGIGDVVGGNEYGDVVGGKVIVSLWRDPELEEFGIGTIVYGDSF